MDGTADDGQARVDHLLSRGVFFSIVWLAGVGSFIAFRNGLKARKLIQQSGGRYKGNVRVWVCLIVGGFGLLVWGGGLLVALVARLIFQ
jgi:hypothetical protein